MFKINTQSNCADRTRMSAIQSPNSKQIPFINLLKHCCAITRHPKFGLITARDL